MDSTMSKTKRSHSHLAVLYLVIGVYGIGFGALLAFVGLFSGLGIFIPGVIHLLIGAGFAACVGGVAQSSRLAARCGAGLSLVVAGLSSVAVFDSVKEQEPESVIIWGFMAVFFVLVLVVTVRSGSPMEPDSNADNAV